MLPSKGWSSHEDDLRRLGERRRVLDRDSIEFLISLGFATDGGSELSAPGDQYFRLRFIADDADAARAVLRHQLLTKCPEVAAISQLLANRPKVPRAVAETVLRNQGYGAGLSDRRVGALLALMSAAQVIEYTKTEGRFRVLARPLSEPELPSSIFIDPESPWSNRRWLTRVLAECHGFIYWLDKHFLPEGLDFIGDAADGARISAVRVLSLALPDNQTRKAKRTYRDLSRELRERGVSLEWRFVDSRDLRDVHDRWIITEGRAWNLPNLNAILSGQHSEIAASGNADAVREMFEKTWDMAPNPAAGTSIA